METRAWKPSAREVEAEESQVLNLGQPGFKKKGKKEGKEGGREF